MRHFGLVLGLVSAMVLGGCGDDDSGSARSGSAGSPGDDGDVDACAGIACGPCPTTNFRLQVTTSDGAAADVTVEGLPDVPVDGCQTVMDLTTCLATLGAGDYRVTAAAPGYATTTADFSLTALATPPGACCSCGGVSPEVVRIELEATPEDHDDAGVDDDTDAGS